MAKGPAHRRVKSPSPWGDMADDTAVKREKNKARDLRQTQWWKQQLAKGTCYYCGKPFRPSELTMDHVVPACKSCNTQKQQLVPVEWEAYLKTIQKD